MNQTDKNTSSSAQKKTRSLFWNRVQIVMIFVVFAAPVIGAFIYKPSKFNNYGDIYSPVRLVENLSMQGAEGVVELDSFRRQWIFLITANGECGDLCEKNLLKIRQIRFMQNNNMTRIRPVFIHTGLSTAVSEDLRAKYVPVENYAIERDDFEQWTKVLRLDDVPEEAQQDRFYVIDPAGNLMLSYPATAEPARIQKDIKRLLKTSQIG